jgi:hypothetical protein
MNNIFGLIQAAKKPQSFLQQAMGNSQFMQNPISKNAIEMYQRGDKQGLNELADNLCKEKGINRQDFEKQIKSQIGM